MIKKTCSIIKNKYKALITSPLFSQKWVAALMVSGAVVQYCFSSSVFAVQCLFSFILLLPLYVASSYIDDRGRWWFMVPVLLLQGGIYLLSCYASGVSFFIVYPVVFICYALLLKVLRGTALRS